MNKRIQGFLIGLGTVAIVLLIGWAALRKPAPPAIPITAPPPVNTEPELHAAPPIALAEARQRIESGAVVVIDVRDANSYIAGHIPGAIHIPLARIEGEIDYLPRGKPMVTYCT
jgi:3-mercaptopyruvate sulfurtransferase SseA